MLAMSILESHSGLGRFKRQNGINADRPNAEKVPSYILRRKFNKELVQQQDMVMSLLEDAAPQKHKKMVSHGFDSIVMTMGDIPFEKFVELVGEIGLVNAYIKTQSPGYNYKK